MPPCCPPAGTPQGCPTPNEINYTQESNPGGLAGPGGIITNFNGTKVCCINMGATTKEPWTPCRDNNGYTHGQCSAFSGLADFDPSSGIETLVD